jgi:hypothetical protein
MKKLVAILTVCGVAFAAIVTAPAKPEGRGGGNKKAAPKTNASAPRPKPQAAAAPKNKVQGPANTNVSKKNKAPGENQLTNAQSKKVKPTKELQTNTNALKNNTNVNRNDINVNKNNVNVNRVTVNKESVARIQSQHVNFRAVPNTAIATTRFNQNYRIAAANNWVGPRYDVFRNYQPEWHDRGWYASRYATVSLIAGGWYYLNNGYWAPAWGYNEAESYYPYDGPIYAGPSGRPADQVVADVQGVLKEQGYYKGEVDGLVGPQTREALTAYQEAAGLPATASIDEPTLESLGLS